jgi:hypothetical protein
MATWERAITRYLGRDVALVVLTTGKVRWPIGPRNHSDVLKHQGIAETSPPSTCKETPVI